MKNLTLFLWIFTTAIAIFFAYHTYTHTRIRHKDLESVMMQNLAVEKGIKTIKLQTKRQYQDGHISVEKQGNTPKDVAKLKKAFNIKKQAASISVIIDSLIFIDKNRKIDTKLQIDTKNMDLFISFLSNFSKFVAQQDSALKDFNEPIISLIDTKNHYLPFFQQCNLRQSYVILRIESKGVDKIVSYIGGVCHPFDKIYAMASAKSQVVKVGENYEANMILVTSSTQLRPEMQISEGEIDVRGDVGEIEITNVKAQNYNSEGKATKTLTGKITIKKADGSDTTFTLSTSYTVKKKL